MATFLCGDDRRHQEGENQSGQHVLDDFTDRKAGKGNDPSYATRFCSCWTRVVSPPRCVSDTWQQTVAASPPLGCDWRFPGKPAGVPDKRSCLGHLDYVSLCSWGQATESESVWRKLKVLHSSLSVDLCKNKFHSLCLVSAAPSASRQRGPTFVVVQWLSRHSSCVITSPWPLTPHRPPCQWGNLSDQEWTSD